MAPIKRKDVIESYGNAYQKLASSLDFFPPEMLQFRSPTDPWTIHEIIVHIADSEVNSYIRCRRFLAEPGGQVLGYDENKWATQLNYHNQSIDDALTLFKILRRNSYLLIKDLPDSVWSNTIHHSEDGILTMDDWLHTYERHVPDHLNQMLSIYREWMQQK